MPLNNLQTCFFKNMTHSQRDWWGQLLLKCRNKAAVRAYVHSRHVTCCWPEGASPHLPLCPGKPPVTGCHLTLLPGKDRVSLGWVCELWQSSGPCSGPEEPRSGWGWHYSPAAHLPLPTSMNTPVCQSRSAFNWRAKGRSRRRGVSDTFAPRSIAPGALSAWCWEQP